MAFIGKNGCFAWAKFTGSGDVANTVIGYNISSAVDNGEGDYTINFSPIVMVVKVTLKLLEAIMELIK